MSLECSAFLATSLDGFIARADGAIDWLERANQSIPAGEDCGYADFMRTVDVLVMRRHTFLQVLGFPEWPYGDLPVHVLSQQLHRLPASAPGTVTLSAEAPAALVARLAASGARRAYVDGGVTVQRFLRAGLLHELTVTTVPVLLGAGRRLFGELPGDVALDHVATRSWPFGFVQSHYRVRQGMQPVAAW